MTTEHQPNLVAPAEIGYYGAARECRAEILDGGLKPATPAPRWEPGLSEDQSSGVYVWADQFDAHAWAQLTGTGRLDVWEIDLEGLDLIADPAQPLGPGCSWVITEPVSADRLSPLGSHDTGV